MLEGYSMITAHIDIQKSIDEIPRKSTSKLRFWSCAISDHVPCQNWKTDSPDQLLIWIFLQKIFQTYVRIRQYFVKHNSQKSHEKVRFALFFSKNDFFFGLNDRKKQTVDWLLNFNWIWQPILYTELRKNRYYPLVILIFCCCYK